MEIRRERMVAYGLGIILLVIGIVCYAAFPNRPPQDPVRIMYTSAAGDVLFDMREHHVEGDGYSIACVDCHHDIADATERPQPCRDCHLANKEESEGELDTQNAFHDLCIECHKEDGFAPVECDKCHRIG